MPDRTQHQPEPWTADGRRILNARRWPLGTTAYAVDARRIVAAVNACRDIPTVMLEEGVVRKLLNEHLDTLLRENPGLKEIVDGEDGTEPEAGRREATQNGHHRPKRV